MLVVASSLRVQVGFQVVDVVLGKGRYVPLPLVVVLIAEAADHLQAFLRIIIVGLILRLVLARTGERGERRAESGQVPRGRAERRAQVGRRVVVAVTVFGVGQFAFRVLGLAALAQPVVVATGGVGRIGLPEVIVGVQADVQPLQHPEAFLVHEVGHQRLGRRVARAVHPVHVRGVLRLLVFVSAGKSYQ